MSTRVTTIDGRAFVFCNLSYDDVYFYSETGPFLAGKIARFIEALTEGKNINLEYHEELPSYNWANDTMIFKSAPIASIRQIQSSI